MSDDQVARHKEDIDRLQDWILRETRLPRNINPVLLFRFLKVCDFDQNRARDLIKIHYEFRAKNPQIFSNREINSNEIQNVINSIQIYPLAKHTKENYRITMSRWIDDDVSKLDVVNIFKWLFMISDAALIDPAAISDGEIAISDFRGFSWSHFFKVASNLSTVRVFLRYVQETVPYKIVQNHYVNCSPMLSKLMLLVKPFINADLFESMHFHTGYDTLYDYIPKEVLPREYGGYEVSANELMERCIDIVKKQHDYVKNEDNFKILD